MTRMPRPKKQAATIPYHADILEMALSGYESAKMKIETEILAIRKALGAASRSYARTTAPSKDEAPKKRRTLSVSARKRIAAAQKKRWDAVRAAKAKSPTKRVGKKNRPKLTKEERQQLSAGEAT